VLLVDSVFVSVDDVVLILGVTKWKVVDNNCRNGVVVATLLQC